MHFKSINNPHHHFSFRDALFQSVADDGSLFMPASIPELPSAFINTLKDRSIIDIGTTILHAFMEDISPNILQKMVEKTFTFPIPLTKLSPSIYLLELFHGPTLSFKDVGARFMAEALSYYLLNDKKKVSILVATSGDTGSAVAHGFYNIPHVQVYILYPSKKVTPLQEKQMTTLGGNIHPIEVNGTFDDCQRLVKQSLIDKELQSYNHFITANSINISRLLPQIIYYFWSVAELQKQGVTVDPSIVVPSGNFGNVTAAVFAKAMGAPIHQLIAATNKNDIIPQYLKTGVFQSRPSQKTLSNAMDVGNPSNYSRLNAFYHGNIDAWREGIKAISISDSETLAEIQNTYHEDHVMVDPHTAVGLVAARRIADPHYPAVVTATAHAGKFPEVIKQALGMEMELPQVLKNILRKDKQATMVDADYEKWKKFLINYRIT